MTRATKSNSNIQSIAGPFYAHLIQLGWVQVNLKPDPTRPDPWITLIEMSKN